MVNNLGKALTSEKKETDRRRILYGRRRGRRLRPGQRDLVEKLLPGLEVDPVAADVFDPRACFDPLINDVWLEIGFGGGEHMAARADMLPDHGFIGCEPFLNGVVQALGHVRDKGLGNVRLHMGDALDVLSRIPDGSLSFVYLLCAGIRLSRFNVITHPLIYPAKEVDRSSNDFIGLPVPAAAGMIATLVLVLNKLDLHKWAVGLPFLMVFISYLMISPIRYPSFKTVDWNTKVRLRTFVVLLASGALVYMYRQYALALLFLGYLIYGVIRHILIVRKARRSKAPREGA